MTEQQQKEWQAQEAQRAAEISGLSEDWNLAALLWNEAGNLANTKYCMEMAAELER